MQQQVPDALWVFDLKLRFIYGGSSLEEGD